MAIPFQPKFVDLVRNTTTTAGTGNIVLGGAVPGFASLATAVAAGEQFYYCIMGVEKPTEREVGRGTMMPNGTVARAPIGGAPTNFSSGNKTIALVVAGEWFDTLRQWIGGGASDLSGLATSNKTSLVAAVNEVAGGMGAVAGLTFAGASGAAISGNQFDSVGHGQSGKGSARYVFAASVDAAYVAANPRSAFMAAGGRGFRLSSEQSLSPQMLGAKGDGTSDDYAALQAWLDLGGELHLPIGHYYSSQRLQVRNLVAVRGASFGFDNRKATARDMPGSRIRFPAGCGGLIVYGQTILDSTSAVNSSGGTAFIQEGAAFSTFENIGLIGGGGASGTGFESRARIFARNVKCLGFGGKGFDLQGSADAADASSDYGNVSLSRLASCYATENGSHGFHVRGRDASVVTIDTCDAISNGGWGFYDQSILGGLMIGCHAASNATGSFRASEGVNSTAFVGCYVEGGSGSSCNIPYSCTIDGGLLAGVPNINSSPAPAASGICEFGKGRYWRGKAATGKWIKAGIGSTILSDSPVAFGVGTEDTTTDLPTQNNNELQLAYDEANKEWMWGAAAAFGQQMRYPNVASPFAKWFAPTFPQGLCTDQGYGGRLFYSASGAVVDGIYTAGDLMMSSGLPKTCTVGGTKASTAWAAGVPNYMFTSATAPFARAAYNLRTNAGKVYRATALGPGNTANAPVHSSGSVTGADGFTWEYLNAVGAVTFAPLVIGGGAAVADATDAASAVTQLNALLARARSAGLIA